MAFDPDQYLAKYENKPSPGGFDPDAYLATYEKPKSGGSEFAAGLVDSLNPDVNVPKASAPGIFSRLLTASKEAALAPIAPFIPSLRKRLLSPQVGQYGPSKFLMEEGRRLSNVVDPLVEGAPESKFSQENPYIGAAVTLPARGLKAIVPQGLTPRGAAETIGNQAVGEVLINPAISAAGGVVAKTAENIAGPAARRALGFMKTQLNKVQGGVPRANAVGQEMLDQGVITPFATPEKMLLKAEALKKSSGEAIGNVISGIDKASTPKINVQTVADEVSDQLLNRLGPSATDSEMKMAQEVVDRIAAYANKDGKLTFKGAQELKQLLQERGKKAFTDQGTESIRKELYAKASGIVNRAIKRGLGEAGEELSGSGALDKYLKANLTKGKANEAVGSLEDLVKRRAGNNQVSLTDWVLGSGALAGGLATGEGASGAIAAGTIVAVKKFLNAYGNQLTATGANALKSLVEKNLVPTSLAQAVPSTAMAFVERLNKGELPAPTGFSGIIARAKARLNESGKDLRPTPNGSGGEKIDGSSLSDFVRKAKVGTKFTYQGKTFKVVPQPGRDKNTLSSLTPEQRRLYASSKSAYRGANTFARA